MGGCWLEYDLDMLLAVLFILIKSFVDNRLLTFLMFWRCLLAGWHGWIQCWGGEMGFRRGLAFGYDDRSVD